MVITPFILTHDYALDAERLLQGLSSQLLEGRRQPSLAVKTTKGSFHRRAGRRETPRSPRWQKPQLDLNDQHRLSIAQEHVVGVSAERGLISCEFLNKNRRSIPRFKLSPAAWMKVQTSLNYNESKAV
jgi:hypothetical protein